MQKLLVLIALLAIAYMGMRLLGSVARPKPVRSDNRRNGKTLPATPLRYDEKTGLYVPDND